MNAFFVVIECPNTGKATRTGCEIDDMGAFKFVGLLPVNSPCEHCAEERSWTQKDAWIERRDASRVHVRAAVQR
jgi:hypothetical protein